MAGSKGQAAHLEKVLHFNDINPHHFIVQQAFILNRRDK